MADQYSNSASIGSALGRGVGSFLSDRLDELAVNRAQQLQQRQRQAQTNQTASLLQNLGFAPDEASFVATLPDKYQAEFVNSYLSNRPQQQSYEQQLLQELQQPSPQPTNNVAQAMATLGVETPQEQQRRSMLNNAITSPFTPELIKESLSGRAPVIGNEVKPPLVADQVRSSQDLLYPNQASKEPSKKPTLADVLSNRQVLSKEENKARLEEDKRVQKETLPFYNKTLEAASTAKDSQRRLNRMSNLIEKGNLPISTFYKLFKNLEEHVSPTTSAAVGAGIGGLVGTPLGGAGGIILSPIGAAIGGAVGGLIQPVASLLRSAQQFTSPDTDEFEKLSNDFVRDAKGVFGSRITDADLKVFLSMVPTLAQTDNGKKAVIRNMQNFLKGVETKAEVMKDILKENGGKRPANLQILVEERSRPELDKLSNEFAEGVDKSVKIVEKTPEKKQLFPGIVVSTASKKQSK